MPYREDEDGLYSSEEDERIIQYNNIKLLDDETSSLYHYFISSKTKPFLSRNNNNNNIASSLTSAFHHNHSSSSKNSTVISTKRSENYSIKRKSKKNSAKHKNNKKYVLPDKETWYNTIFLSKHSIIIWLITSFVCCFSFTTIIIVSYSLLDILTSRETLKGTSWNEKTILLISLSISTSFGTLILIPLLLSKRIIKKKIFPGVIELWACQYILDLCRLFQNVLNTSFSNYNSKLSLIFFLIENFLSPSGFAWIGAIATNLFLSTKATSTANYSSLLKQRHRWCHMLIWTYSIIHVAIYVRLYPPVNKERTKDVSLCTELHCVWYSFVIFPSITILYSFSIMSIIRQRIQYFYPKSAIESIALRTNHYVRLYIIVWLTVYIMWAFLQILKKVSNDPVKNIYYSGLRLFYFFSFGMQGVAYACITLRELLYKSRILETKGVLHMQNVHIDDLEFGMNPVVIGEGAFAVVFKAKWENHLVAVKVFKMREVDTETMKMEAFIASQLHHKYLLRTFGCSLVNDNDIAIITEFMDGGTLEDLLLYNKRKNITNSYKQILLYGKMIALAIQFLHSRSPPIVHRDLKPTNCLLTEDRTIVKIADFGCSRWINTDDILKRNLNNGTVEADSINGDRVLMTGNVGTPCWTAPELMRRENNGLAKYSVQVDVFSFSIILWQLYTGKIMPYEEINGSLLMLEEAVINGYRPQIPDHCPNTLKNIIIYGWDNNPLKRPTFEEILGLIEAELITIKAFDDIQSDSTIHTIYSDDETKEN